MSRLANAVDQLIDAVVEVRSTRWALAVENLRREAAQHEELLAVINHEHNKIHTAAVREQCVYPYCTKAAEL